MISLCRMLQRLLLQSGQIVTLVFLLRPKSFLHSLAKPWHYSKHEFPENHIVSLTKKAGGLPDIRRDITVQVIENYQEARSLSPIRGPSVSPPPPERQ